MANLYRNTIYHLKADPFRMDCLAAVADLALPSAMICAGLIRNLIWDVAHNYPKPTPLADVDVVWFDAGNTY